MYATELRQYLYCHQNKSKQQFKKRHITWWACFAGRHFAETFASMSITLMSAWNPAIRQEQKSSTVNRHILGQLDRRWAIFLPCKFWPAPFCHKGSTSKKPRLVAKECGKVLCAAFSNISKAVPGLEMPCHKGSTSKQPRQVAQEGGKVLWAAAFSNISKAVPGLEMSWQWLRIIFEYKYINKKFLDFFFLGRALKKFRCKIALFIGEKWI